MAKIKTTILMDQTLKKLAQVYAIQHDMCLGDLIDKVLSDLLLGEGEFIFKKPKA
jgi:hypothetical protein